MISDTFTLSINGKSEEIRGVSPTTTLLDYLRQQGLTGTKEGCAEGDCGACTVALAGRWPSGLPRYEAVNSCLVMLGSVAGREVTSVEGLSPRPGPLHPVQEAMVKTGGSQCGYCTPGFVMSLFAAYYDGGYDGGVGDAAIDTAIEGNLCRCTGYLAIRRAAAALEEPREDDPFLSRLETVPAAGPLAYEGGGGRFYRPTRLSEVIELLSEHPEARLVAGGTDLGLEVTRRYRHFPVLIALEGVEELQRLDDGKDYFELGAAVTLSHLEAAFRGKIPALDEMLASFAARQIRNRATIGGNLATASPIGDLAPVFLSLDAEVRALGPGGERFIPLAAFFTGYRRTALTPAEVVVSVRIPKALARGATRRLSRAYKVAKRPADDISVVAAAFALHLDAEDRVVRARLAYGGVAATPVRARGVEEALKGKRWDAAAVREVKGLLEEAFTPLTDPRGSAGYRRLLIGNLFEKFLFEPSRSLTESGVGA
ncbi:MAG: xanthine dehydrogenase small subunit [Deinococcota bacterium]|nr:xanthine dehydrogenase small subunit [Deinococcota bacterium]MDQ3460862.1 xanthine dehydrogenase small subunit [Deinococcota bacterium]